MGKKQAANRKVTVHWIGLSNLKNLKVKRHGYIAGCLYIPYVITDDGQMYFVKRDV